MNAGLHCRFPRERFVCDASHQRMERGSQAVRSWRFCDGGHMTTRLWFLRRLDLFEGMSEPEMERLGSLLRMRSCRGGVDVVVRPSGDRIYIVKLGRVRVLQGDVAVAVLGPGQLFGTSELFGAAATRER